MEKKNESEIDQNARLENSLTSMAFPSPPFLQEFILNFLWTKQILPYTV